MATPHHEALARSPDEGRIWERRFMPVVLHAVAVGLVGLTFWLTDDPVLILTAGGAIMAPTHIVIAWLEARRAPLWLSPLSFYFAWYSLSLGFAALHMANRIDNREIIGFSVTYVHPDEIAAAYVLYVIGSFALHVGIQALRPLARRGGDTEEPDTTEIPVLGFGILWIAGMIVRLFGPQLASLGAAIGVLNWAPFAALCAYALVRGSQPSPGLRFWAVLTLGMMVEVAFNLRTGSKAYIMYSFIPALWMASRQRRYRKWLIPAGAALLFFYVAVLAPVVHSSRQAQWSSEESQTDRILSTYNRHAYEQVDLEDQTDALLSRQFDPTPVAFLYGEVRRSGLRYGETLDYLAYAFIPRPLWPEKPNVTRGAWFTLYLGQARNERSVTTSTGQTATGELYWNFGVPGVIAGMAVIGLMIGALWRIAGLRPHKDGLLFLLYITLCFTMVDMPEAGTVIVGNVYRFVVIGFLIWVARHAEPLLLRRSSTPRVPAG